MSAGGILMELMEIAKDDPLNVESGGGVCEDQGSYVLILSKGRGDENTDMGNR